MPDFRSWISPSPPPLPSLLPLASSMSSLSQQSACLVDHPLIPSQKLTRRSGEILEGKKKVDSGIALRCICKARYSVCNVCNVMSCVYLAAISLLSHRRRRRRRSSSYCNAIVQHSIAWYNHRTEPHLTSTSLPAVPSYKPNQTGYNLTMR